MSLGVFRFIDLMSTSSIRTEGIHTGITKGFYSRISLLQGVLFLSRSALGDSTLKELDSRETLP